MNLKFLDPTNHMDILNGPECDHRRTHNRKTLLVVHSRTGFINKPLRIGTKIPVWPQAERLATALEPPLPSTDVPGPTNFFSLASIDASPMC